MNITTDADSEGENLIRDYFEEKGIKYETRVKLTSLENDYADYRLVDFFLPRYNIYLEFLGKWQDPEKQRKYKQKMAIYYKNNIPCVYLFPDNLGTLEWTLKHRLRKELRKHSKLKWRKYLFYFDEFWKENFVLSLILLAILFFGEMSMINKIVVSVIFLTILGYQFYKVIKK